MRRWRIAVQLLVGWVAVLAGPVWLGWSLLGPQVWNERTLHVEFDSVRYERASLVFTYVIENRTWRPARFPAENTEIRAMRSEDLPAPGYPNLKLPLDIPGHAEQRVEIRLEIANQTLGVTEEQARKVLEGKADTDGDLVMRSAEDSLRRLEGFELVDRQSGMRVRFPRGW
jgi:hypothetical protein